MIKKMRTSVVNISKINLRNIKGKLIKKMNFNFLTLLLFNCKQFNPVKLNRQKKKKKLTVVLYSCCLIY